MAVIRCKVERELDMVSLLGSLLSPHDEFTVLVSSRHIPYVPESSCLYHRQFLPEKNERANTVLKWDLVQGKIRLLA